MSAVSAMSTLVVRDVALHLGPQLVLGGISATVTPGDRYAVVGPNGVGKTTLLQVMLGALAPDQGSVERQPAAATVGLLPQERDARAGETLAGYLGRRTGVTAAEAELTGATTALAEGAKGADDRYALALDRYLALGAADLDTRAPAVLADLGLPPERLGDPVLSLSGGQLARLALASVLLAKFDVLLLDEPTNDLDLAGLARLEEFLTGRSGALVVVSHDRTFLERVATDVLEIDEFARLGRTYGGGFGSYLAERERAHAAAQEAYDTYSSQRDALLEQAKRKQEWARSGAQRSARKPADNDKFVRHFHIQKAQGTGAGAARAQRAADRLAEVEEPRTPWELRLKLDQGSRSGARVAGLAGVVVERGAFRLGPVDLDLRYADRMVVVGPNGAGKSSLISVLLGQLEPTAGERWIGHGVVLGQIDQVRRGVAADVVLLDAFRQSSGQDETEARTLLAKFGLGADDVVRQTGSLSPGERTRADLALLVARQANLLVLDEPTNHLDLPAVEQLEQALADYDGTLVLASHDRKLVEAVHPTHIVHVLDGHISVECP
ncbi:ATPase components of ABC transporters with duplicated ATPase domains [Actinopolymorpha cephalotaxi]|uniref:ATPase components of ABC transporters with duplicated ATPase domains n=1 Tax=Actinopolymorpha cephalotaxi TaxID=504797 RepID=A0A1I2NQZ9_9ACTN|nr:ABC-F family ATP-binding cassette domain-containing protein [Actinopolymorpha cephalotaxi]NYH85485.1 ATPase subunit of ABC transporter with duplicated ATPase domains [Actinopolymorpha cephalotaxi]SFG03866.1 ATPase components of ABC transporters with duplicated ATPase domains [Actinopolymorpha cephalotaxi]